MYARFEVSRTFLCIFMNVLEFSYLFWYGGLEGIRQMNVHVTCAGNFKVHVSKSMILVLVFVLLLIIC